MLNIGRSSLKSMQNNLDNTAHNIANANTYGYKNKHTGFQELLLNVTNENEVLLGERADEVAFNAGSKNSVKKVNLKQGSTEVTGRPLDMAIDGRGFFGLRDQNGELVLTRNGSFHLNEDNTVSNSQGYRLDGQVVFPEGNQVVDGVEITSPGGRRIVIRPNIYDVENIGGLIPIDSTNFYANEDANLVQNQDMSKIISGSLEMSNVHLADTMTELITTQRAYSGNARFIQTTDEILGAINNLKR